MIANGELEERCPRCLLPRSEWTGNGDGVARIDQLYCCQGCADDTGCSCLEAGPAA